MPWPQGAALDSEGAAVERLGPVQITLKVMQDAEIVERLADLPMARPIGPLANPQRGLQARRGLGEPAEDDVERT